MLYSIANAAPRNIESHSVNTLLPDNIRGGAQQLVEFLEEYYNYLNAQHGPSVELSSALQNKDLDAVSVKYLDLIQGLIAKNVPNSKVLSRVALYKIIVRYYNGRGSEDNILTMFKLLFNENASVSYPKEYMFEPSSSKEKSWPSHTAKIQDSYYWQVFSYVIRGSLDLSVWKDSFSFLHPAGLQMFYELVIECFASNIFDLADRPKFKIIGDSPSWILDLLLELPEQHTPFYQPGWLREQLLRILSVSAPSRPGTLLFPAEAWFQLIALIITIQTRNSRNSLVRHDYDYNSFKFKDSCTLKDGILDKTIEEANENYSESNGYKFLNLSTYITLGDATFSETGSPALTLTNGLGSFPALTLGGEVLTLRAS